MTLGVYPGTFDPITHGHRDIIARSLRIFDRIIVAVASNPNKHPLFDVAERVEMVKVVTKALPQVEVASFDGLLVSFLKQRGSHVVIRGLRAISDFEYEFQMALVNRKLDVAVETVFLTPGEEYAYLTSSIIKEVATLGGPVTAFVNEEVAKRLIDRLRRPQA